MVMGLLNHSNNPSAVRLRYELSPLQALGITVNAWGEGVQAIGSGIIGAYNDISHRAQVLSENQEM